mmetsp:Transcript_5265/g.11733  ORF Transcript_5265/g.11733 Transcript_5265/m.11733 type:complete len:126 (+) Transcript_5265:245-622(+)
MHTPRLNGVYKKLFITLIHLYSPLSCIPKLEYMAHCPILPSTLHPARPPARLRFCTFRTCALHAPCLTVGSRHAAIGEGQFGQTELKQLTLALLSPALLPPAPYPLCKRASTPHKVSLLSFPFHI